MTLLQTAVMSAPRLHDFIKANYTETLALCPALALLILLAFIISVNRYIRAELRRTMQLIVVLVFSLVLQNYLEYRLAEGQVRWLARTLVAAYGYAIRPVLLLLFMKVIAPQRRFGWAWALVGVNAAVYMTSLFSHICFWIDENNHWHGGPLNKICLYVSVILLVGWFVLTLRVFRPQTRKETWVPVLVFGMILGSIVLDRNVGLMPQPVTYLTLAVVISCVAYTIWLFLQFAREHEQALMAEQRIQIMMTQIQPHFLYNTIATIRALCRRDADKAGEVTEKFGEYLRRNMASLDIVGLIPFRKELEHTRLYAEIEMVRFENIRVEYDIQDDSFDLPPLTVQPLVENAIRHGVRIREEGLVRVSSRRGEDCHVVEVWDNGTGFDTSKLEALGSAHIGIRNVRERIETMCGGEMKVDSLIGAGTRVTITLPLRVNVGEVHV